MDKRNSFGRYFMSSLPITIFCFIGTYIFCGFYYEEFEAFFNAFYSGKLSPGTPFYSWYYMAHIGISYLYVPLYLWTSGVEWMSFILYAYMLISCTLFLSLFKYLLKRKISPIILTLLQIFIYITLMADNVIHFQYTRIAYFICASSLFALCILFKNWENVKQNKFVFAALNFFFIVGTLTRLEPAIGILLLMFCFGILFKKHPIRSGFVYLFPVLVTGSLFFGIIYDINHTDAFYKKVEPDIETQMTSRENFVPVSEMKTQRDSMRHVAAVNLLWSDPHVIDVPFLRSLIKNTSDPIWINKRQWHRVSMSLKDLYRNGFVIVWFNVALLVLMFFPRLNGSKNVLLKLILAYLAFVVLVVLQVYFVKITMRSFVPYISLFTIINLYCVLSVIQVHSRRILVLLPVLGFFLVASARDIYWKTSVLANERQVYANNMAVLKGISGGHTLVLNTSSFRFFTLASKPFHPFDFSSFRRVYINEAHVLPLIDSYNAYLESECKCDVNNFSNFFKYLERSNDEVYFLSDEPRMSLIIDYLRIIHHFELKIKEVPNVRFEDVYQHEMIEKINLKIYTFQ